MKNNKKIHFLNLVSQHSNSDPEVLSSIREKLSIFINIGEESLLGLISENEAVDTDLLIKIIDKTNDTYLLRSIVRNKNADATVLNLIKEKINQFVDSGKIDTFIITSPLMDAEIFNKIINKANNLSMLLFCNNNLHKEFKDAIKNRIKTLIVNQELKYENPTLKELLRNNSICDSEMLSLIIENFYISSIQLAIITKNRAVTPDILKKIINKTDDKSVLYFVMGSPAANEEIKQMAADKKNQLI